MTAILRHYVEAGYSGTARYHRKMLVENQKAKPENEDSKENLAPAVVK